MSPAPKLSARAVAFAAVRRVIEEGGYSTIVVPNALSRSSLDVRDRAFAADLAYGTIRRLRSLDWALEQRSTRPVARMSPIARDVLRLGAYQLLFTGAAPHAAVGETVSLAAPKERGFVNAVLRTLASDPPAWPAGDADAAVAVRTGMQPWAVTELRRLVGDEAADAAAAIAAHGLLCLRVNTRRTTVEAMEAALAGTGRTVTRATLDPTCLLIDGGDPASFPGFGEGWFAIQDQASAFVVRALDPRPGERILDACAAPGGKAHYAAGLVGEGGLVVATDLHPQRAGMIRRGAERLRVRVETLAQDAAAPAIRGPFDRVLVDAPCSGIGSARRRPELLWRPKKDTLSQLARLQVSIASASTELLRPGGRLVYSVCTFPRAETDAACDAILRHRPELVPVEIEGPDGPAERVRIWPHRHDADGMFVAAFERRP
ncbi:MAG: 16S rRNA (cytosine(967)-C(5))-methyltransferase RsmB [Actinomycetota bacterium]